MADEVETDIEQCKRETQMMENVKEFLKGGCKCSRGPKDYKSLLISVYGGRDRRKSEQLSQTIFKRTGPRNFG